MRTWITKLQGLRTPTARRAKPKPPSGNPGSGKFYIALTFFIAFAAVVIFIFLPPEPTRWSVLAFGICMFVLGVYLLHTVIRGLIARCAMLLLTPYGVSDQAQAEALLTEYLNGTAPTLVIRLGQIAPESEISGPDVLKRYQQTLQGVMAHGPMRLDVDRMSAVLLWQRGAYTLYHYGNHHCQWDQIYVGAVDLRPQSVPIDENYWTLDGMLVHLKGTISYSLVQNPSVLQEHQVYQTDMDIVRRALLPTPDWREKVTRILQLKLRDVVRQIALSDFFVVPDHLHLLDLKETVRRLYTFLPLRSATDEIKTRVIEETRDRLVERGVQVRGIIFDTIEPPQNISDAAKRMYDAWLLELDKEAASARQARSDIEHAHNQLQLAKLEHETQVTKAETDKKVEQLKAEAEAVGLETRMKARATSAVEFARRMELVEQALGDSLDGETMRELLRALGLLVHDKTHEKDGRSFIDLFGKSGQDIEEK